MVLNIIVGILVVVAFGAVGAALFKAYKKDKED